MLAPSAVASNAGSPERRVAVDLGLADDVADSLREVEEAIASSQAPVDSLEISALGSPFGDAGIVELLARHPELAPKRLALLDTRLTARGIAAILSSRLPTRLEVLDLRDNLLGDEGVKSLAESRRLASLKELNLGRCHVHADGAEALAAARGLGSLERLELEYNFIGVTGATALARSTAFPRLKDLGLAFNYLKDDAALALAQARPPSLASLDLRSNDIKDISARALAASTTSQGKPEIFLENNLLGKAMLADRELQNRLRLEGAPPFEGRETLGGSESFSASRGSALKVAAAPPAGLPATVEFRELWIWEFGLVGDFPTFMTPLRPYGNGKGRTFAWLDRATLTISGSWLNEETLADRIAWETKPAPGDRVRVQRLHKHAAIVRRTGPDKVRVTRVQSAYGAAFYADLEYDRSLDAYFAPIAEHVLRSIYFDRRHLEEKP